MNIIIFLPGVKLRSHVLMVPILNNFELYKNMEQRTLSISENEFEKDMAMQKLIYITN